jgi:hypothetical protein
MPPRDKMYFRGCTFLQCFTKQYTRFNCNGMLAHFATGNLLMAIYAFVPSYNLSAVLLQTKRHWKQGHMVTSYNGMLPCFLRGFLRFLVDSRSKSWQILQRVVLGSMMSSTKPEILYHIVIDFG